MKKLIGFFILIWTWFISLFKRKKVKTKKETLTEKLEKRDAPVYRNPLTPAHNNRKRTKSRHIQVDKSTGRTIYHGAK